MAWPRRHIVRCTHSPGWSVPVDRQGAIQSLLPDLLTRAISTSYIERQNLTLPMMNGRFTRLTNAFSKTLAHLKAAITLHFAYYNLCRVHSSIKATRATKARLTDHVWTVSELLT